MDRAFFVRNPRWARSIVPGFYPIRLDAGTIVPFIIGYLDRMHAGGALKDGRAQLELGQRILTLAESGGQKTPVTPLLVTLFVESALRRVAGGHDDEIKLWNDADRLPCAFSKPIHLRIRSFGDYRIS
jgi:hypothetical protein